MHISSSSDKTCTRLDLKTGNEPCTIQGHHDYISAVSITPDGQKAVSGSFDNNCILWNLATGEAIHTLRGHKAYVHSA